MTTTWVEDVLALNREGWAPEAVAALTGEPEDRVRRLLRASGAVIAATRRAAQRESESRVAPAHAEDRAAPHRVRR